ncbi:MATE family efflux transporter, partial [bacterium]|nr:MATE family efflux transporter [bacterium]
MAASQTADMGSGSVPKLLFQLALPAVVAQIINLLYNIVDRIYIGHIPEIGATALTGVGLCMPILMLVNAFAMLCGSGGAPRAAICMGQDDNDSAERIMGNCFSLLVIIALVLTVVFYLFAPPLLVLFGASENTLPYALDYTRIYVLGSLFVMTVLGMNTFVTTQGFATFSMLTTVIGAVCNIVLDPIFIFVLGMGVRGAATATVISQGVSAVWVLHFLTGKRTRLHLRKRNL